MKKFVLLTVLLACTAVLMADEHHDHDNQHDHSHQVIPQEISDSTDLTELESLDSDSDSITVTHTKLGLVRREYDYKKQVWLAAGMMAFIAVIMSSAQTWNPR